MDSFEKIGISRFKTKGPAFDGKLFTVNEDFTVEEIQEDGTRITVGKDPDAKPLGDKKDFLRFSLVKNGLSTAEALSIISRQTRIGIKRFGYLGNKDKNALTAQRISVFKAEPGRFVTENKRYFLKDLEYSDSSCKIGALYGNHFTIKIRDFSGDDAAAVKEFAGEAGAGLPNYYGPQRFGSSGLNVIVSKSILKGDFKRAVADFITMERSEGKAAEEIRKNLRETLSPFFDGEDVSDEVIGRLVSGMPNFMSFERTVIQHLQSHRNDYIGALRTIPKYIRLLILQSYQAYLFNRTLSLFADSALGTMMPTLGFDLKVEEVRDVEVKGAIEIVMKEEGISLGDFKLNAMPEASLKTFERPASFVPENLAFERAGSDMIVRFDLRKGSYATILLMEMFRHL